MPTITNAPQAYSDEPRAPIALQEVESNQVGAIGYDAATQTLAVRFKRGAGAIYHYPDVSPETHLAFIGAESMALSSASTSSSCRSRSTAPSRPTPRPDQSTGPRRREPDGVPSPSGVMAQTDAAKAWQSDWRGPALPRRFR